MKIATKPRIRVNTIVPKRNTNRYFRASYLSILLNMHIDKHVKFYYKFFIFLLIAKAMPKL